MTPTTSDNIARSVGHSHGYVVGCLHALIQTGSIVAGEYRYSGAYYDGSEMHPCYILKPRAADVLMACIEGRMASPVHRPGREPRPAAKRSTSRRASMKELIPIQQKEVSGQQIKTVNARELHSFLESKQHFADWIKGRIINFDFMEGADFITIHNSMTSPPTKEYHLTLDMAKELSMVERNARGKQARQYFIECERVAQQRPVAPPIPLGLPDFNNPAAAARAWADVKESEQKAIAEGEAARQQIAKDRPKVEFAETVSDIKDGIEVAGRRLRTMTHLINCIRAVASMAMQQLSGKNLSGADHYYSTDIDAPSWARHPKMKFLVQIGKHRFFRWDG